jgi:hypothetical protein
MVNMNDVGLKQVNDTVVVQGLYDDFGQMLKGTAPTLDMANSSQKLEGKDTASPKSLGRSTPTVDLNALFGFRTLVLGDGVIREYGNLVILCSQMGCKTPEMSGHAAARPAADVRRNRTDLQNSHTMDLPSSLCRIKP